MVWGGSTVATLASFFRCCTFSIRYDESDGLPLAGPLETVGADQHTQQPMHRPSMSVAQSRRNTSVSVPRSSRFSFDVRPASLLSARLKRSRSSQLPLPNGDGHLRPPSLTPTLPERRAVSPLPDFSQLRTSQILELSSMPWLLAHSFREDEFNCGEFQVIDVDQYDIDGSPILPKDSHLSVPTGRGSLLKSSEELSKIPVPPIPRRPESIARPRARSSTASSIPSGKAKPRRKSTLSISRKHAEVEDAVQELRSIVDEKRGDTAFYPISSMRLRSNSFHHVPAVAPAMKMPVGTELLSDIGSAFSKPLADGYDALVPSVVGEIQHAKKPSGEITTFGHRRRRSTLTDRISNLFSPSLSFLTPKSLTVQPNDPSKETSSNTDGPV